MSDLKSTMDVLSDLYSRTGLDWHLTVYHELTEPTCPTVTINPDGFSSGRWRIDADTIEQGIAEAVERVRLEIFEGRTGIDPHFPLSQPDDVLLAEFVGKWQRGDKLTAEDHARIPREQFSA